MCCCLAENKVGSCGGCTRMLPLPARNIAPGNVALVLSPPRTRSLPGAFFAPVLEHERSQMTPDQKKVGLNTRSLMAEANLSSRLRISNDFVATSLRGPASVSKCDTATSCRTITRLQFNLLASRAISRSKCGRQLVQETLLESLLRSEF